MSIHYGYQGPNLGTVSACSTANHSIGEAARLIEYGDADVMVAGGAEATVSAARRRRLLRVARAVARATTIPRPRAVRGTSDRDGFVLGEGAGVLVLEELEHAKARGARIYCELAGYGMSADAHHITAPPDDGDGARAQHAERAAQRRHATPTDIDYINAHGTSTPLGDIAECIAVKRAFGDHAQKLAVSSTKSMTGHLLGAAGGIEAVFTVLAMRDQVAPPTANLVQRQDPQCDLDFVPLHRAQDDDPRRAVELVRLRRHQRDARVPHAADRGRRGRRRTFLAMALIVQKYGGTSVGIDRAHPATSRAASRAIHREGHQLVVVVSAMAGETNRLLALAKELVADPRSARARRRRRDRRAGHDRPARDRAAGAWDSRRGATPAARCAC